jgi:hypothetical protein
VVRTFHLQRHAKSELTPVHARSSGAEWLLTEATKNGRV